MYISNNQFLLQVLVRVQHCTPNQFQVLKVLIHYSNMVATALLKIGILLPCACHARVQQLKQSTVYIVA